MNSQEMISAVCSLGGAVLGVLATSRLTNYRLERLEKNVERLLQRDNEITILKEQMREVLKYVEKIKGTDKG